MKRSLTTIIDEAERSSLPWGYVAATFIALVLARNLLEGALGPKGTIGFVYFTSPSSLMVLDHFALFYVSLFLSFSLLLSALARERIGAVMRVMTPAWALLLLPPVLDHIITSGEGMRIEYVLELKPVFLRFFDPRASLEVISPGQRVEILGACLLAAAYVLLKTRSWLRTVAAFLGIYAVLALHGVLPSLFARASLALRGTAASPEFAYFSAFRSGGIVADESRKLAILFLLTSSLFAWFAYRRHDPEKARAVVGSVRSLRALHYLGLTLFGVAFGLVLFSRHGVELAGAGDVLGIIATCLATFCAFQASVAINDLFDEEGDRASGERRPLVEGILTRRDLMRQALVFSGAALLFALNVKYSTFLFMVLAIIVSLAYSARPLRLKRFPLVSNLTLGLVSLTACLVGFSVYADERALALFPPPLAWVIVLSFGLGFAAKDLKDVEGDAATGVWTLPVLLGPVAGRAAVATLVFLGYLSVAMLLPYTVLIVPSVLLGLASAAAALAWKRPQLAEILLAVCLVFTAAVAFVVLSDVGPLLEPSEARVDLLEGTGAQLRASRAEASSDWAEAATGFTAAADAFQDDHDVHLRAGATLFEQGRYRESLPYLARAADLNRRSPIALEYLVKAESKVGRNTSAEWLAFEAVTDGMRPGVFWQVLAEHHMDEGNHASAAAAFTHALALGRPDVPARLRLGDALFALGCADDSLAEVRRAVAGRPSSSEARDALGRLLAAVGDSEGAVTELRTAVELAPDGAAYWNNLGAALRMAGHHSESLSAIDEAVRLAPLEAGSYFNRGLTLDALGRTEEARRQYPLLALENDPNHAHARAALERAAP